LLLNIGCKDIFRGFIKSLIQNDKMHHHRNGYQSRKVDRLDKRKSGEVDIFSDHFANNQSRYILIPFSKVEKRSVQVRATS